jgi:hypothetical protein
MVAVTEPTCGMANTAEGEIGPTSNTNSDTRTFLTGKVLTAFDSFIVVFIVLPIPELVQRSDASVNVRQLLTGASGLPANRR